MSTPTEADPVKRIAGLISPDPEIIDRIIKELESVFGPVDRVSPLLDFDKTRYYEKEMGRPLFRRFISFRDLMPQDRLPEAKLETNRLEERTSLGGRRVVNIDPGYLCLERLVLATGKNFTHRIYLKKGIFADLTLIFHKGSFRPLEWTYPDFREPLVEGFFNELREDYRRGRIAAER
ncbi:MAG: DUF4416 family protein [Desulfobacteraceae bacterium]